MRKLKRVGESSSDGEDVCLITSFNGFQNSLDRYFTAAVVGAHVLKVRSALVDEVVADGTFLLSKHWSAHYSQQMLN